MSLKVKGITITINGDATGFKRAMREAKAESTILANHMKSMNKLMKLDPTNLQYITRQQELYNASIEQTRQKLNALRLGEIAMLRDQANWSDADARNFMKLQSEITATEAQLVELKNAARQFGVTASASTLQFQAGLASLSTKLDAVAASLAPLSVAAGLIGAVSTYMAADFESAFAGVRKTVNATEEEYENLYNAAIKFSETKPISASDVARIMELGGQLGVAADNLTEFADVIADLTVSTDMELDDAATVLAQFMNVMGGGDKSFYSNIDRIGAALADLGNNSATTESQIMNMAFRISGTAKSMGANSQEVLALATSLSSLGIKAEMGGNAISTIMRKIDSEVSSNGENLSKWADIWATSSGRAADEFSEAWGESVMNTMSDVVRGIALYSDETDENFTSIMSDVDISYMRQIDTMARASAAGNTYSEYLERANRAYEQNVALVNEANQRYATTESKLSIMLNSITALGIAIGNQLLPTVNNIADAVSDFAIDMSEMDSETMNTVITLGAVALAAAPTVKILSVCANVLKSNSKMWTNLTLSIKETSAYMTAIANGGIARTHEQFLLAKEGAKKFKSGLLMVKSAMASIGFMAAISALILFAENLYESYKHSVDLKKATTGLNSALFASTSAASSASSSYKNYSSAIKDSVQGQISLNESIEDMYRTLNTNDSVLDYVSDTIEKYAGRADLSSDEVAELQNAVERMNEKMSTSYKVVMDESGAYKILSENAEDATDSIYALIEAQKVQSRISTNNTAIDNLTNQNAEYEDSIQALKKQIDSLYEQLEETPAQYQSYVYGEIANVQALIDEYSNLEGANSEAIAFLEDMNKVLRKVANGSATSTEKFIVDHQEIQSALKLSGKTTTEFASAYDEASSKVEGLSEANSEQMAEMARNFDGSSDSIVTSWGKMSDSADTAAGMMKSSMQEVVDTGYTSGWDWVSNIASGIWAAIKSVLTPAVEEVPCVMEDYAQWSVPKKGPWSGAERGGERSGEHWVQNISRGITNEIPTLAKASNSVAMAMSLGGNASIPTLQSDLQKSISLQMKGNDGSVINIQNMTVSADDYATADQFVTMLRKAASLHA